MGQGDHLGRGRLRSAWTHRVVPPHLDSAGMPDAPLYTEGAHQMPLGPGDYSSHQHQHLQQLHHPHSSSRGGAAPSGAGADPQDSDTPRKLNPTLTLLTQQQQQLFSSRGRALFTSVDREILCNALACAGASMADPLMSMVDSYYAGKLGTTALAALGSNGALFSVLYFLCFTALAVLCTQVGWEGKLAGRGGRPGASAQQGVCRVLCVSDRTLSACTARTHSSGCIDGCIEIVHCQAGAVLALCWACAGRPAALLPCRLAATLMTTLLP